MSALYLTRARLRTEDSRIVALLPLLTRHRNPAGASHHRVWSLMSDSDERRRDFLFRDAGDVTFVLSGRPPAESPLWEHHTRVVPTFEKGDTLQFTLRASPSVKRKREGKHSAKRDPILERLKLLSPEDRRARRHAIAQEETTKWLSNLGQSSGYALTATLVENHEQVSVPRRGGEAVRFSIVDVTGILTVTCAEAFADRLGRGFGPAKAWGCGLMLCKRIDR
jgi:CRISPR system Cascade subunit CasE